MSRIITESQKCEIEELAIEHRDALIAYGADLYRDGLVKGAIIASAGIAIGYAISVLAKEIKKHYTKSIYEEKG